jgi:hypothetical protein
MDCAGYIFNTSEPSNANCHLKMQLVNGALNLQTISGPKNCDREGDRAFKKTSYKTPFRRTYV